jgi:hypothetical protein
MERVIIRVVTSRDRRGYALEHNQREGFKGIIGRRWAWFKYRADAERSAEELMECWNL